jgi:outer membrane lipoprotein-sorting protein
MATPRVLICLGLLALCPLAQSQTPPTVYTITQGLAGSDPGTLTIYRNGDKVVMETVLPTQTSRSLYDLKTGVSLSWDPKASPIQCSAGRFSGDWGDPFAMTAEVTGGIAKGDLKPAGTDTVAGIATQVYEQNSPQGNIKAWFDKKDNLVMRATMTSPGTPPSSMVDIRKISFAAPDPKQFTLPAACAGVHPAPTPAEAIADETGDSADNYVNAIYGPGSANSCSILVRVVTAKTMTPITNRLQFAIDTTYNQDNPPHYEFGMARDGSQSYSGGGVHEITNQAHNGMVKIDNPPAYFNLSVNLMKPNYGAGMGLIYRQCFRPVTVLLYVVKDPNDPQAGADWLYAKGGKFATAP